MLDPDHLREMMRLRGIANASRLARIAGIPARQTVSRILSGVTQPDELPWQTVARLARALGVSTDELNVAPSGTRYVWRSFPWTDQKSVQQLFADLNNVRSCLICTQGMDTYLQHDALHDWVFHQMHSAIGWDERRIHAARSIVLTNASPGDLMARQNSDCVHRIIARERFFQFAFANEPDWLGATRHILKELDARTIVALIPEVNWSTVNQLVLRLIRRTVGDYHVWDKVCVADTTFALFRPSLDEFQVTFHRPTVELLRSKLESIAKTFAPYEFPLEPGRTNLESSVKWSVQALDRIARTAPIQKKKGLWDTQAENTYWSRLALGAKF